MNRAITGLVRCGVLLSAVMLGGCGSVGDAVNPVNWYRGVRDWVSGAPDRPEPADEAKTVGKDYPKISNDKRPETPPAKDRADLAKGLASDRSNAQYTQETLRREGNPTRPLSAESAVAKPAPPPSPDLPPPAPAARPVPPPPPAPPSAQPQSRAAEPPAPTRLSQGMGSSAPPAPAQQQAAVPPPAPPAVQQQAAVPAPPSVQQQAAVPPPAPPAVQQQAAVPAPPSVQQQAAVPPPAPVAVASAPPATVDEIYRRRLAEFNGPVAAAPAVVPAVATMPARMAVNAIATSSDRGAVVLTPPWETKKSRFKSLDAFDPSRSAASFQVGDIAFGEGTTALSAASVASLKEIAALAREHRGMLRVVGHSDSARLDVDPLANRDANRLLALRRADTVGDQLVRLGVPAAHIFAGTAAEPGMSLAGGGSSGNDLTEIYIDY